MKRLAYYILILATAAVCSCRKEFSEDPLTALGEGPLHESARDPYQPGVLTLELSDELTGLLEQNLSTRGGRIVTGEADLDDVLRNLGAKEIYRLFPYAGEFEARTRAEGLHRFYRVIYDEAVTRTRASGEISRVEGICGVEFKHRSRTNASSDLIFNDPELSFQWHYSNSGYDISSWHPGADINVVPVWENLTKGSPEVVVAVVDGGIDYRHTDLDGVVDLEGSYNFVYEQRGHDITPANHGTHVAGTIAAVNNNSKGVCGVAGGDYLKGQKGVTLISCQIFADNPDDPLSDLPGDEEAAIKWGADHGAVISQNSWGFVFDSEKEALEYTLPPSMKKAIDYFNKYAGMDATGTRQIGPMAGGVVFFSSGNNHYKAGVPASYPGVVSVGAYGPDGYIASYSNFGEWVDIAAPGGNENNADGNVGNDKLYPLVLSTIKNNKYAWSEGTSMACPHVSGVAALLVSYFGGEGYTREALISQLLEGADYDFFSFGNKVIGPKLDALGAFLAGEGIKPSTPRIVNAYVEDWQICFDSSLDSGSGGSLIGQIAIFLSKDKSRIQHMDPANPPEDVLVFRTKMNGEKSITAKTGTLEYNSDWYAVVYGTGGSKSFSGPSEIFEFHIPDNLEPESTALFTDKALGLPGSMESIDMSKLFADPEGFPLEIKVKSYDSEALRVLTEGNELRVYPLLQGEGHIEFSVSDGYNVIGFTMRTLSRNDKVFADVYPNPVRDKLYIRPAKELRTRVKFLTPSGSIVMEKDATLKPFGTEAIDVTPLAPGLYYIRISNGADNFKQAIVKL